ncbi:MAG: alanine racemase [Ilumatobacteraceae bacterium]
MSDRRTGIVAGAAQRAAWVEVDLAAVAHNVRTLKSVVGAAKLLAVVKADGYGHGAIRVAETALSAGAHGLAVALVQEGIALRRAGIEAPILILSEQPLDQVGDIVAHGLIATAYSVPYIDALEAAARRRDVVGQEVHLKIDTGMNRVGVQPERAVELAGRILACSPSLLLGGTYTHLACADDLDSPFTAVQVQRFDTALADLREAGIDPGWVHLANSAGVIGHPTTHRDMVRVGIAMYGIPPDQSMLTHCRLLRPALALKARVSLVKRVRAGEGISYGQRHRFDHETTVATVPIGYADGVPRRLAAVGGKVLIGGRRCPIVGVVTMDQLMVDVGDADVAVGDEVVLLGSQGEHVISPNGWGALLDTIGYEVVCALSERLPRHYRGESSDLDSDVDDVTKETRS